MNNKKHWYHEKRRMIKTGEKSIFAFFFRSSENVFLVPRSSVKRIGSVEVKAASAAVSERERKLIRGDPILGGGLRNKIKKK